MTNIKFTSLIDREVERLYRENPPRDGEWCTDPVTHGNYIGGLYPIKLQKENARRALLAREWFFFHGPADAQPLPIPSWEHDEFRGTHDRERFLFYYIVAKYACSLEGQKYDFIHHPPFNEFVGGLMWWDANGVTLPNCPKELPQLRKRFPPRWLTGLLPCFSWVPPKEYAERMESYRRHEVRAGRSAPEMSALQ